jgi:signal peptidase I
MDSTVSQELSVEPVDSDPEQPQATSAPGPRPFWRSLAEVVVMLLILIGLLNLLTVSAGMNGSSMTPSLSDGQHVLASRFTYALFPPQRGDVVVLTDPLNPDGTLVRRVIGLPGERVELRGQQVLINNQPLTEDYLGNMLVSGANLTGTVQLVLQTDQYYLLGDNRLSVNDSRSWGPVPADSILGRVWASYWPPDAITIVHPASYDMTTER